MKLWLQGAAPYTLLTVVLLLPSLAQAAPSGMFAVDAALLGPASRYSASFVVRAMPKVEGVLTIGMDMASATSQSGQVSAEASGGLKTLALRGRFLPFGRHNLALEGGMIATYVSLDASASDTSGNSIEYSRSGVVAGGVAGIGYALRTDVGFRLNVLIGWMNYINKPGGSDVKTKGAFDAQDRAKISSDLDDISDGLADSRPYLELGVGWAF